MQQQTATTYYNTPCVKSYPHIALHCNNTLQQHLSFVNISTHCNMLQQHTAATHCSNTLQQHIAATHCSNTLDHTSYVNASTHRYILQQNTTARHCSTTLQHNSCVIVDTRCNMLQQHTPRVYTYPQIATYCNKTLQQHTTAANCNTPRV